MENFTYLTIFKANRERLAARYGEAIFLFQFSDLYMAVGDDAIECNRVLGTSMSIHSQTHIHSSAFPSTMLDTALPKLVRAGYRICIVDKPLELSLF